MTHSPDNSAGSPTDSNGKIARVRFINTFQPPGLPLLDTVFPAIEERGARVRGLFSSGAYRRGTRHDSSVIEGVWVPARLASNKRWCHLFFWMLAPLKLLFGPRDDLHVYLTQPPFFYVLGGFIDRLRGVSYIVHVMDVYPDILDELDLLDKSGPIYRMLSGLSVKALNDSEKVVVIGRCMKTRLVNAGVSPDRIEIVPNWTPASVNGVNGDDYSFRREMDLEDRFIVMYSGNMGTAHEFQTILGTAESLRDYEEIVFVLIGGGARRTEVEERVREDDLENVRLLEYQPIERLASVLRAADVHFISLREGFEGVMVPSKFYSALASGRPIIYEGHEDGEIGHVIRESNCGAVVGYRDEAALTKSILSYYEEGIQRAGDHAKRAHQTRFQPTLSASRYASSILEAK